MTTVLASLTPASGSYDDLASLLWRDLRWELDAWATAGQTATLWWRDDDAVRPTPALARLRRLTEGAGVPLALAVVPASAEPELARALADWRGVVVLQHGYDHLNHARKGEKKAELNGHRPLATLIEELEQGALILGQLFGAQALPVLVPPWNRIAPALVAALAYKGFKGLSTYRSLKHASAGLVEVDTHIDPVDWRGGGGFVGDQAVLEALTTQLRERRLGSAADPREPTGLLTHHLVMSEPCWDFLERLLEVTVGHPAVRWLEPRAVFRCP